ncbi:MAG: class I SAM-dependent methyltransferase [bacterium]|nr:class I SAM-dependent methyltransferase [bacterium]
MSMMKYFQLSNYWYNFLLILKKHNSLINKLTISVSPDEIMALNDISFEIFDIESGKYLEWVDKYYPQLPSELHEPKFKKLVEFYTSFHLLNPQSEDVFLDAAGGIHSYLNRLECKKRYMQDMRISDELKNHLGSTIEYIDSNAAEIPLPDSGVDKISVHHSIEHFQQDSDTQFVKEVQRMLSIGGKCCIGPIFLNQTYIEMTGTFNFSMKFDDESKRVIDITSIFPGGETSGNYARIYDLRSFKRRIIDHIDGDKYRSTIYEIRMDGQSVPDFSLKCHRDTAHVESPYRVLVIEQVK